MESAFGTAWANLRPIQHHRLGWRWAGRALAFGTERKGLCAVQSKPARSGIIENAPYTVRPLLAGRIFFSAGGCLQIWHGVGGFATNSSSRGNYGTFLLPGGPYLKMPAFIMYPLRRCPPLWDIDAPFYSLRFVGRRAVIRLLATQSTHTSVLGGSVGVNSPPSLSSRSAGAAPGCSGTDGRAPQPVLTPPQRAGGAHASPTNRHRPCLTRRWMLVAQREQQLLTSTRERCAHGHVRSRWLPPMYSGVTNGALCIHIMGSPRVA